MRSRSTTDSWACFPDPEAGRQHKVYAFIGTLTHSRYKFIAFVHTQDQKSFLASHVRMFAYFNGCRFRPKWTGNLI